MGQYKSALDQARKELETSLADQQALETKIVRLRQAIDALAALENEFVFPPLVAPLALAPSALSNYKWPETIPVPDLGTIHPSPSPSISPAISVTEACKNALIAGGRLMSPVEVKEQMEVSGFDFSTYDNPMAFVHSILKRFVENGRAIKDESSGKALYKWNGDFRRRYRVLMARKVFKEEKK